MKKAVSLILALAMMLSLAACGGAAAKEYTIEEVMGKWHSKETNQIITVEPTHISVYTFSVSSAKSFSIPVLDKNKLSGDNAVGTFEIKETEAGLQLVAVDGSHVAAGTVFVKAEEIIAQETITENIWVNVNTGKKLFFADGEYNIEGESSGDISMVRWADDRIYFPFQMFRIVIDGETTQLVSDELGAYELFVEPEAVYAQIGETVETDVVAFTLTGFNYVHHLNPKTFVEKEDNAGGSLGPGKDMVFANPEFTVRNLAKESLDMRDSIQFTVDYNGGYLYNNENAWAYLVDSPGIYWQSYGSTGKGNKLSLSPLETETYEIYIPAINLIETDTESALVLRVILPTSNGTQEILYIIR